MPIRVLKNVLLTTVTATMIVAGDPVSIKVMPAGHSIARGFGSTNANGWRKGWYESEIATGRTVDMVGEFSDGVGWTEIQHEAVDGTECGEIDTRLQAAIPTYRPDVVLLMCGVVDALHGANSTTIISRINTLLDHARDARPTAWVVVTTILPTTTGSINTTTATVNVALPGIVEARQLVGERVMLADLSNVIDASTETIDGLHPNDAGYAKIVTRMLSETVPVLQLIDANG